MRPNRNEEGSNKMTDLLVLKERIKAIYQKYELYLEPGFKFVMALIVFLAINANIGYSSLLRNVFVVIILSLLSAFTPSSVLVLLAAFVTIGHVYAMSKMLSIIIVLILIVLFFLFARFAPKEGYIILALPILFILKVPYMVPILLGIIATPVAIIPTSCGIIIYYLIKVIKEAAVITTNTSVEETLELYKYVMNGLVNNKQMIFTIAIFALVILVTYIIRRMTFDHAFDIAIGAGVLVNILGFLIGDLGFDVSNNIVGVIFGSIAAGIVVYIIQFFRLALEYTRVERLQFEDDDYYYYVKAVPKINITVPDKNVRRFTGRKTEKKRIDELEPYEDLVEENFRK
jgi:hypothetical protein